MTGPAGSGPGSPGSGEREDPPPFWGRWSWIYLLVAGLLAIETLVFWWLARWAS
jgi:hypothetical protein